MSKNSICVAELHEAVHRDCINQRKLLIVPMLVIENSILYQRRIFYK